MRAVITGGTGMVGAALVRTCIDKGYEVCVLVPESIPRMAPLPEDDPKLSFIDCDVRGLCGFGADDIGFADLFFHLAWLGTAPKARSDLRTQLDNVEYTLDAVELAHRLGCSVFVGAGSQAECGRVEGAIAPDTPCFPETGYGVAKLAAGQMSRLACQGLGIRHEWARILSVYGPGDNPHTMVMQVIADALIGKNPKCTKGEQMWDYLYCDDCGRALLAMAERGVDGRVYPVGGGAQRPLADYIRDICDISGTGVKPDFGAIKYPKGQVMNLVADTTVLKEDTGWEPRLPFYGGLQYTLNWYKKEHLFEY